MKIVYALESFPTEVTQTLFLAGPTPRQEAKSWRSEALGILAQKGYRGHVFVPESEGDFWAEDYNNQVEWEEQCLAASDVILFWVPRDIRGDKLRGNKMPMLGLTTNDEWGAWKESGKVVYGSPTWADSTRYQETYAEKLKVPKASTLDETVELALEKLGKGSLRVGSLAPKVPAFIWGHPAFKVWYESQVASGNEVQKVDVKMTFYVGPKKDQLFVYVLHPEVWVASEGRHKVNELVVLRPDISVVALYKPDHQTPTKSKFVLIREFRTPVRNSKGFVYELPGGSSLKEGQDPLQTAAEEVSEEVGIQVDSSRLEFHGRRQMGATLVSYHANFYSAILTDEELAKLESDDEVHGANQEERTYIVVKTLGEIVSEDLVDWPMMGMLFTTYTSKA